MRAGAHFKGDGALFVVVVVVVVIVFLVVVAVVFFNIGMVNIIVCLQKSAGGKGAMLKDERKM